MEKGDIKHTAHGGEGPSQQEIEEALRKAGIYAEGKGEKKEEEAEERKKDEL